ncbi:hypothetical protein [Nonomuraea dietziae]|uniref:hypothetical protein n=1 Tax=Nonomuraea dietziae TaxID=65515 RepID=UPI00342F9ADA
MLLSRALLFPGTATYDPEFSEQTVFVLGVHGQVFMALVLLLTLLSAAAAPLRHLGSTTTPGRGQGRCRLALAEHASILADAAYHLVPTTRDSDARQGEYVAATAPLAAAARRLLELAVTFERIQGTSWEQIGRRMPSCSRRSPEPEPAWRSS